MQLPLKIICSNIKKEIKKVLNAIIMRIKKHSFLPSKYFCDLLMESCSLQFVKFPRNRLRSIFEIRKFLFSILCISWKGNCYVVLPG